MLTAQEREDIRALLEIVVSEQTSPRQALVAFLDPTLHTRLHEGSAAVLVDEALTLSTNDGYRQTPPALVQLLRGLLPDLPETEAIAARLSVPPPPVADPFDALVLNSNLPFLDRLPTRQALKSFLHELRPSKRIVVINGDHSPGKSYTTAFVEHVFGDRRDIGHCLVAVDQDQGAATGPLELARDLVTNMGRDTSDPPPPNTNQQRWTAEVVNWVLSAANQSELSWWFILDGFNAAEMRDDTRLFIDTLATKLGTGVQRDRHRLILLDFDRTVLAVPPGSISDQTTSPVPHASVVRAVDQILATSPPDLDRGVVTASVLDGFADPVTDLRELGVRLGALIQTHGAAA